MKSHKHFLLVAHYAAHSTAFVALYLREAGYRVTVSTSLSDVSVWRDHEVALGFLRLLTGVEIIDINNLEGKSADVILLWWRHPHLYSTQVLRQLEGLVEYSHHAVLFYDARFGCGWEVFKAQLRDLSIAWKLLLSFRLVVSTKTGREIGLFSLIGDSVLSVVGPGLEYEFRSPLRSVLYRDWDPGNYRPFFVQAGGTSNSSEARAKIVIRLSEWLKQSKIPVTKESCCSGQTKKALWTWDQDSVSFDRYPDVLRRTDFSLCLPGTTWTSRVPESIVCGCIPILDSQYLGHYDLGLEDGINCFIVKDASCPDAWASKLAEALSLTEMEKVQMRQHLAVLSNTLLAPGSVGVRWMSRLRLG